MVHSHLQLDFWHTILISFWIIRHVWAKYHIWDLCCLSHCIQTRLCMVEAVQKKEFGFVNQMGLNYQANSTVTFDGFEQIA